VRALVIHESVFGNTAQIAEQVAAGLARHVPTLVLEVEDAPAEIGDPVRLLVLGGPTHSTGMSRPGSRAQARLVGRHPVAPPELGQREWLRGVHLRPGLLAATFDTRLPDRLRADRADRGAPPAADGAAAALVRAGLVLLADPEGFRVRSVEGPLVIGERERAVRWGEHLGVRLCARPESARPGSPAR
jgi:hypothetical protein